MTASDISAQALEYLEHIEMIRVKSGRLQGGLSGELKKRKTCLEEMIRALQIKAESKNDPQFLKHKLSEMMNEIKKYKKEEEKRNREVSELREIINELKKENKEMRVELMRMKVVVSKSSEERHDVRIRKAREEPPKRLEDSVKRRRYSPRESSVESRSRSPSVVVLKPPLGGKLVPIPEGLKLRKDERLEIIKQQIGALTKAGAKICQTEDMQGSEAAQDVEIGMAPSSPPLPQRKPRLKVLENIQLVPPSNSWAGNLDQMNEGSYRNKVEEKNQSKELTTGQDEWTKVSRKERRKEIRKRKGEVSPRTNRSRALHFLPLKAKEGKRR